MAWRVFPVSDPSLKPQWVGMNIDDCLEPSSANETNGTIIIIIIFFFNLKKDHQIFALHVISVNHFQLLDHLWTLRRSWI